MHARRLHIGERAHRVLQFALQGTLIVDLLIKLRTHPIGLVEDLKSQTTALQSFGRRGQPRLVQLRGRNLNAIAIGGGLITDLCRGQKLRHLTSVFRVHIGIKHSPVGTQCVPGQTPNQRNQQQGGGDRPTALSRLHRRPAHPSPRPDPRQPIGQLGLTRYCRHTFFQLCSGGHVFASRC